MDLIVRNLSEQIFDLVRDRIVSGSVPANLAIRQDALANELGVSKIPLREALARLEQEGLLVSQPNRGFFVRPLTGEEAEEVYALRLKIEPDAVAAAAECASDADREYARLALDSLDRAIEKGTDDVGRLNRAFHLALVGPAHQPLTFQMVERLHIMAERYVRKHLEPMGRDTRANEEHEMMLEAWLSGDARVVAELTRQHIAATLTDLRKQFNQDEKQ
ncbi:GntR family transcriptional regulator [Sphingomonas sp. LaA6.9]|uniref:GntR family transcriptional regulator n=1 Tax=Sphingomonas sp. LaA6.9 TaxID=2919914 RepID=UPI001F4F931A|nr:GntR family transcriptional regulator [Sphingomonas sp. LaA6.9]MCJ8157776.1 GntR family transcriptional regulator [Sphingomonas sp. LaA6.9]